MKKNQKRVSQGMKMMFLLLLFLLAGCGDGQAATLADTAKIQRSAEKSGTQAKVSAFSATEDDLSVDFLDVGQGSATLVQLGDSYMLIDGGDREYSSYVVSYLKKREIKKLDYIVISHYDADHLNGIIGVLHAFPCAQILAVDYEADTKLYQSYQAIVAEKAVPVVFPAPGDEFSFGQASLQVMGPIDGSYEDSNANSLGVKLIYGETSFLLCGDATQESEADMLSAGVDLDSDVFVANHHGSKYSNSEAFLDAVSPTSVVVSSAAGNSYGHPEASVLQEIKDMAASLYRTDLQGTIQAISNGVEITFKQKATTDYRSGSEIEGGAKSEKVLPTAAPRESGYIVNTNTQKFHLSTCSSVGKISEHNRKSSHEKREDLLKQGYEPCKICDP